MKRKVRIKSHIRKRERKRFRVRTHNRKIYVPPAWKNVKFYTNKKYVATGIDVKGRLQYIYPKIHVTRTSNQKYNRIDRMSKRIPDIMKEIIKDVNKGIPESEATYTMYKTGFRPGSEKDTKAEKKSYGVITLQKGHVHVEKPNKVHFRFTGKKGVEIDKEIKDKKLAEIIDRRKKSKKLFPIRSEQVRKYFKKKTQGQFKLKDLRTLKAQEVAKKELKKVKHEAPKEREKKIMEAVSKELGNTPAVAKSSYIPPQVLK